MEFPFLDDNLITYTGSSNSEINISQGETINSVLNKLIIALAQLTARVNSCSFCEGEENSVTLGASNILTSGNVNQNPTIVTGAPAKLKSTPSASGINFNFNLDDAIASLGDVTVLQSQSSVTGLKNGFPAKIVDTSKTSASVNLSPDNFPAQYEAKVRYQDSRGEKTLSLRVPVSNTLSEINLPLQGNSSGVAEIQTQEDLNLNLQDRLLNAENLINSLNSVNISGFGSNLPANSNINQTLSYLFSEIENIKAQLP